MDYLAESGEDAFWIGSEIYETADGETRLALYGAGIRPYRTVFTFQQETRFDDEYIYAKAVDPRVTLYAVCDAVRRMDNPHVGALLVMAEECAMDVARKAVTFLQRRAPKLDLIVNADVPGLANLGDADLDLPAIRVFEGHNFIDPSFGIRVATRLMDDGVAVHLSAARSGSQTILFAPLAPTLSLALPGENIHAREGRMSLLGTRRCVDLLMEIGERHLVGSL
jgi:putative aminopeptidase FrvX